MYKYKNKDDEWITDTYENIVRKFEGLIGPQLIKVI